LSLPFFLPSSHIFLLSFPFQVPSAPATSCTSLSASTARNGTVCGTDDVQRRLAYVFCFSPFPSPSVSACLFADSISSRSTRNLTVCRSGEAGREWNGKDGSDGLCRDTEQNDTPAWRARRKEKGQGYGERRLLDVGSAVTVTGTVLFESLVSLGGCVGGCGGWARRMLLHVSSPVYPFTRPPILPRGADSAGDVLGSGQCLIGNRDVCIPRSSENETSRNAFVGTTCGVCHHPGCGCDMMMMTPHDSSWGSVWACLVFLWPHR
jgi:hypothetical protein